MKTILVIDDEPEIRELLRIFLERAGFASFLAEDGLQGLQYFETEKIDLVITDMLMSGHEGIETILQIREKHPEMPILAMSGGGRLVDSLDLLNTAKLLGAKQTFSKPFNPADVVKTIKELIGKD